jgi:hypothetical protein
MRHESKRPDHASRLYDEARDELFSHLLKSRVSEAEPERQRVWLADTLAYLQLRYQTLPDARLRHLEEAAERFLRMQAGAPV